MLSIQKLSLKRAEKTILKDLNFKIAPGEMVAIIGASGAGKSSLFRILLGETKPSKGAVLLDEINLNDLNFISLQQYRRQIGVVFQEFKLLPKKTVFENVAFALEVCGKAHEINQKVPELLAQVGLSDRSGAFPHELSGGESQRTAIARALAQDPKIIIADEATGNLDPKNAREIAQLFQALNQEKGLTIVFSTHDPEFINQTKPRIIRLEKGTILFDLHDISVQNAFEGLL